jgi:signal transduction histidine kinase
MGQTAQSLQQRMGGLKALNFDASKIKLKQWQTNNTDSIYNNEVHFLGDTFNDMVKQINQQFSLLTENDRIRRELLAHLSHDLRTPLATVQGYIETLTLKQHSLTADEQQTYLATAQRNVNQLKRLIDQIFELAHLDNDQATVNLENFALAEVLYDILAKFTLLADKKKITLTLTPNACNLMVYSDIAKLERIMTNLLENAIRHTGVGGTIKVNAEQQQGKIKITVTDTGSGIAKEDIAYIFEARYRGSNAIEDNTQHTGLGLAISQKLSLVLDSELKVSSELGKGSIFSLLVAQPVTAN